MRCKGYTLSGKPCKRNAQISGYCINHLVSFEKQQENRTKQPEPELNYNKNPPITLEDMRKVRNWWHKSKLMNAYHDWIRKKRAEDKLKLRRQINKEYRERIKLKGLKKS